MESIEVVEAKPAKKTGRPKGSKHCKSAKQTALIKRTLNLHLQGASEREIAKATGQHLRSVHSTVSQFMSIFEEVKDVQEFRANKTEIMDAALVKCFKSLMSQEKHDKASLNNVAYAMRQLHDVGRLERGLSTANVAHAVLKYTAPAPEPDEYAEIG